MLQPATDAAQDRTVTDLGPRCTKRMATLRHRPPQLAGWGLAKHGHHRSWAQVGSPELGVTAGPAEQDPDMLPRPLESRAAGRSYLPAVKFGARVTNVLWFHCRIRLMQSARG